MTPELLVLDEILRECPPASLWCADENVAGFMPARFAGHIITNRFDIIEQLQERFPATQFNDFALQECATPVEHVVFRIAKEKALNLHIIRQAFALLPEGGKLHLLGYKNEGINSLASHISDNFPASIETNRHKAQLQHIEVVSHGKVTAVTDEYSALQWLGDESTGFYSKPGIFGWNKVDKGSELLMHCFDKHNRKNNEASILDLGCGYGYLSTQARRLGFPRIDATDNNAAAIMACDANFRHLGITGKVFADNHGSHCRQHYDIILCNPPFHQGFGHHKNLTEIFTEQAHALLKAKGQAWFVVNQFIGIEKIAGRLYKNCELLDKRGGFKVFLFEKQ